MIVSFLASESQGKTERTKEKKKKKKEGMPRGKKAHELELDPEEESKWNPCIYTKKVLSSF